MSLELIMNSLNSVLSIYTKTITFSIILLLLSPVLGSLTHDHLQPPPSPRELLIEDKTRLGSTPPSCHNKCNGCHPCMAVQVPSNLPSENRVEAAGSNRKTMNKAMQFLDQPSMASADRSSNNKYSNYKPLGWKCRCGDHFYNP
ncbi:EPIDERMAL PATTERNING FACTOR-like protein 1 [Carica papaya]|uniref:EPIDERMAL PATTERNING FACTOR-like protein 1 n=1 Tax=Carica papaya TaxID=3649 RepID=UPI000B8CCAAC|nr:EPIDERMAL PATTERNING FACTOR-like protein 1 [Carica papaya]